MLIVALMIVSVQGALTDKNAKQGGALPAHEEFVEEVSTECEEVLIPEENQNTYNHTEDIQEFEDILGKSGYYIDHGLETGYEFIPGWVERFYYEDLGENKSNIIAYSFGFGDDYCIDIDGDGVKELVCNCTYGGDGHEEVYVYKEANGKIKVGYLNWLNTNLEGLHYWGVNAVQTKYDSVLNKFIAVYAKENETIKVELNQSLITYSDFDFDTGLPEIDIEKAFELYS